ncbi:Ca-activated chloride channel family protein [Roseimicrobium gellanilyticum]|uniref:Ca-activated chloride channel family protein n=1 Tax=Roseimicrobium gellanilyticum TaxID=748857 RepID=A0A366H570_9BACT|nr:VWA domain-containing protein [Roseimicrobium gellanilyticum]RBP36568.1 Ca-activated chloride channel family protein [Roseimicrobium gellanilyticum]
MNFAAPNYAYLLFLLPVIALFKIWADLEGKKALEGFASSARLRSVLLEGASVVRANLHFGLILLGIGFFVIALTRPQYGKDEKDLEQSGRNILIAMDTSKSMLAEDVAPSRMERARLAAQDLLKKLEGDRVGIIAFAGRAFLQAPLTTDQEALVETIQTLDHTTIPRGGSSLASAINLAVETAQKARGTRHGLVIFTDGQETDDSAMEAARKAADLNIIILPVGVGSVDGTLIPDPNPLNEGGYIRDENGNIVKSRLESGLLREVARITGGEYVELASQPLTQTIVDRVMANLDRHDDKSKHLSRPIERYQWPLFAGILCIMLSQLLRPSSRRSVRIAALPVDPRATVHQHQPTSRAVASPATVSILAMLVGGWFLLTPAAVEAKVAPEVQAARKQYQEKQYQEAKEAYTKMLQSKKLPAPAEELYYGLGAAELQLKEYDMSARSFSDALKSHNPRVQKPALRGLATALYSQGEVLLKSDLESTIKAWTDSRDHFDTAMGLEKDQESDSYRELSENRALVQKRLDEVKQMLAEQKARQKAEKEKRKQKKQQGQGQGEEGEPEEEPEEGEGEQQSQNQNGGNQEKQKPTDALQEGKEEILEGDLRAGDPGKPSDSDKEGQPDGDHMRNDSTGYTPFEARSMLKMYSDEQKSTQYLMRRERAPGGKDY